MAKVIPGAVRQEPLPKSKEALMLLPCGSCGRHIRESEASCPFCKASFDAQSSAKWLQRAATAAAVGVVLTLAGCPRADQGTATKYGAPPPPMTQSQPTSAPDSAPTPEPPQPPPDRPVTKYGAPKPPGL